MSIAYREEHDMFRKSVRKFLQKEVVPYFKDWYKERQVPREIWMKFGSQGFLCPWLPEEYGGADLGFESSVIVSEELAKADADIAFSLHSDVVVPYIAAYGNEEQKQRWLPGCASGELLTAIAMTEPGTGSDLAGIETTAVKDGSDYIINGQKLFITNGWDCDLAIVVCKTGNSPKQHHNLSILVIEEGTSGFIKAKKMEKMGRHTEGTAELVFEDCRVPQSNRLGEEGKGFYYLMEKLQQERLVAALGALTAAEKMFEEGLEYAKTRKAFGQPIGKFQHNSFKLAEMATEIEIGRTFFQELVNEHIEGKDIVNKVSMAKWWISEMANRVAYDSLQLHGGYGYMEEYPISRQYQNVRVDTIFAGTTEIMKSIIAKNLGL
ncbi:acyl-CoA dehydrogenase [Peribacillus cavernae]|uniref:Acyl-CoA dehydrogenase n=1 Tax=Peribacillus cavernae TaxID=1674310 RepID=A0A433HWS4_9BACI|nr:acyl-CoA dehydrogenase family protein [Peribacillus cavernae]MDQ0218107.1 acyl-CoA dehydrogenase [Peribacillus cavernae]RUQ32736.1 acyl-CoA dehydrogenase [Peribacillus cavernae]